MNYWLFKSEPACFGIDDLIQRPKQTEPWDGVRNYQVRNMLRDQIKVGDLAFFYHSNCKPPGIAGIMEIVKAGYPDYTAWDLESDHFDPKSTAEKPLWYMVDVQYKQKFAHFVSLPQLKLLPKLENLSILKKGNRLSITPIHKQEWQSILKKGQGCDHA